MVVKYYWQQWSVRFRGQHPTIQEYEEENHRKSSLIDDDCRWLITPREYFLSIPFLYPSVCVSLCWQQNQHGNSKKASIDDWTNVFTDHEDGRTFLEIEKLVPFSSVTHRDIDHVFGENINRMFALLTVSLEWEYQFLVELWNLLEQKPFSPIATFTYRELFTRSERDSEISIFYPWGHHFSFKYRLAGAENDSRSVRMLGGNSWILSSLK